MLETTGYFGTQHFSHRAQRHSPKSVSAVQPEQDFAPDPPTCPRLSVISESFNNNTVSLCSIIVDKMDSNKDGFISEEELKVWIKNAQKTHIYNSVEHQWKDFDMNGDGLISWEEYKNVTYGSFLGKELQFVMTHIQVQQQRDSA